VARAWRDAFALAEQQSATPARFPTPASKCTGVARKIQEIQRLGVIASSQPNPYAHGMKLGGSASSGAARGQALLRWKEFLDERRGTGVRPDYPSLETITRSLDLRRHHPHERGRTTKEYGPEQNSYSSGRRRVHHGPLPMPRLRKNEKGQNLNQECWADFVVLDRDITKVATAEDSEDGAYGGRRWRPKRLYR